MESRGSAGGKAREHLAPDWQVRDFVKRLRRVAVVGMPASTDSESMVRAERLLAYDFELFPVHSECRMLLGRPCVAHLHEIPGPIDIVLVLPEATAGMLHLASEAIRKHATVFWVEDAPIPADVAELLVQQGVHVVAERSLEKEFARL
jgi:predicted CoA-binding protein